MPITISGSGITSSEILDGTITTTDMSASDVKSLKSGRKNLIINGGFDVWQRGTSFSTTGFTADRWNLGLSGAVATVNKKVYSNTTKLELAVTTGDQNCAIENKIEDCKPTSNKNGVLSFNVKRTAGSRTTFQYIVGINYGSGGSNPENIISPTQFAISGTDTRIEIPITFPDISAKTVGAGSFLPITFRQDDTSTAAYTLEFNDIQLELGSVATDFEHRSYGEELALCQRYYYLHASGASSFIGIGTFISATQMRTLVYFPVTMRSEPTLEQVTGTDYFNIEYGSSDSFDNFSAIVTNGVNGTALYKTGMTSTTAGYSGVVRGLNASSQLAFDAEL